VNPLKEFLNTWKKRQEGILPPVNLRVTCVVCGHEIMAGATIDYTERGIRCKSCMKSEVLRNSKARGN
jgi:DNA-directed RNA polymerase subunit RPC12/RpoP